MQYSGSNAVINSAVKITVTNKKKTAKGHRIYSYYVMSTGDIQTTAQRPDETL
jgi:hypothetical protein